jgi:serine/threonine-protein kinase HipA
VLERLAALTPAPRVTGLDLMRQVAFAYLTGNGDMHGKNLSVVEEGGELRAAPAYDVPCTYVYGDTTMALTIDQKDRENITRTSFLSLGRYLDVPARATMRMLDGLLKGLDGLVDAVDALPFDARRLNKLKRVITDRGKTLG